MDDNLDIDAFAEQFNTNTPIEQNDIMVVGVGGGGGNAVNHMYREGVENVTFVVCNTDRMAVENSPVKNKVVIGDGRGAGNRPEKARNFAEEDIDKIEAIFNNKARMVFVTAGMGGGTGTGAGPVVARVAKEKGLLTVGIVTIPFVFEGRTKISKALDGAQEMSKYVDALLIINNERLTEIYPDLDFFNAFAKADDTLSTAARSISEIITTHGYINLDFEDVDTTLRNGGTAIISTGYGEGDHRVTKALENALKSPLLKNRDIYGSKRLLINLYMSRDEEGSAMSMVEVNELRDFVSAIDSEVDVIWGASVDNSLGNKVKITILASGFDVTIRDEGTETLDFGRPTDTTSSKPPRGTTDKEQQITDEYGPKFANFNTNYVILSPEQMDNDAAIDLFEQHPALNRPRTISEQFKNGLKTPVQNTDDKPSTSTGNVISF
ncbi:MAG: cell division protein FtsZ [Bacteroides sp.]|nr:cell division protein FtsZ [Bacteroides sp.]MCM1413762.1 cell division protein FtsZ [Bacteroides sp.]MCM1472219.1 cell division protein FtsZ [Bacteroides sp.]